MKQRTFLVALLTALTATLGLMACASSHQATSAPKPTLTPTATQNERVTTQEGKPEMMPARAALEWADKNHSELAKQLLDKTLGAASFIDASYTTQITENVETKVRTPKPLDPDYRLFTVPIEVTSTFTVDKPMIGGTFTATLPISLTADRKLPLEQMITGYSIANEDFTLDKE